MSIFQPGGIVSSNDLGGGAPARQNPPIPVATDLEKLSYHARLGQVFRIHDEANRIERFIGGATPGIRISNISNDLPLVVINQPTDDTKGYYGQPAPSDEWYADWDSNTPDAWSIISSGTGVIWTSDEDIASPLDVVSWTKVFEEPDEENPLYPATPTLVAAPAANDAAWIVERNTVALTIDNALGSTITVNGVACPNGDQTFVGWVDPNAITSSGYVVYAVGVEVSGYYISQPFSAASGATFAIPFALPPRCAATLYLVD